MSSDTTQAINNLQNIVQEYITVLSKDGRAASASLVASTAQEALKVLSSALAPKAE